MSQPDMGYIFYIKNQWNILVVGNYYVNYQNLMLLISSDTKRTLMHLLLFTNSAQRELVSKCTQSIHNRNWLSLPYILDTTNLSEIAMDIVRHKTLNLLKNLFSFVLIRRSKNCILNLDIKFDKLWLWVFQSQNLNISLMLFKNVFFCVLNSY